MFTRVIVLIVVSTLYGLTIGDLFVYLLAFWPIAWALVRKVIPYEDLKIK